jgi:peptidyl-prolyl cis-trans isomerase SurA
MPACRPVHHLPAALACLALLGLPAGKAAAQTRELSDAGELLDGIAALVNDGIVLKSELDIEVERIVERLRAQGTQLPPPQVLREQVLERLVIQRIQLQRAQRANIDVSDETLNQALATIAERNNTTLAELPQLLAGEGVDYNAYRLELRNQIALDQLRQKEVIGRIGVSPREVDEYLARQVGKEGLNQEFLLAQILVAVPPSSSAEQLRAAEEKINDLARRIEAGEDFAQLAVAYSDGQQALEGGSLGWRKGAELPSLFADVAPGLAKGQVSPPLRSSSGFHLVKLNDRRGGEPVLEDQARVRHILIQTNEILDDAAARQKLTEIRARIVAGEDFAAVAKVVSEDEQSAVQGGELGWSGPGSFVPAFEQVANEIPIGEISQPFKSQFGWHILRVEERRTYDATADRQRQRAIIAIRNSKLGEETEIWARRLRDEAYVEYQM